MRQFLLSALVILTLGATSFAQSSASINISANKPSGLVDQKIYGQLFEHIYFSANNGVWQEMIYERSFEPEHFPGIHPRDGYFDGWYADDDNVLHSPTRYEQPIDLATIDSDSYEISMDINWRSYKLARRSWSGGLNDIRIEFKDEADGSPLFFRIHDPYYEARTLNVGQTQAMREAAEKAKAQESLKNEERASLSFSKKVEKEVTMFGRSRMMTVFEPVKELFTTKEQLNEGGTWHHLRIVCKGKTVKAYWDGKLALSYSSTSSSSNSIKLWENYTETYFKNITIRSTDGKKTYFEGQPKDVLIPDVAPQWESFGNGIFSLAKDDAVNMRYSQKITSTNGVSGVAQGPQNVIAGETYLGSIYAKGDSKAKLSIALRKKDGTNVVKQTLGTPSGEWTKYEFSLKSDSYNGDADFAIEVEGGTLQVDQVSMTTKTGQDLGGFRPDIYNSVKELAPTCLRWPGGGYVAQYHWKWGIGPQEERQRWPHWMWMDYDQNAFGTDEFIRFCREINTEPVIVLSVGFERPESEYEDILNEALDWVRYCNEPATGEWGKVRAANGHPEPYNVKYWEIDNEMWEMGIERYEKCVRDFSTKIREIDPRVKIIACGGFQEDEQFINRSGNYFDYLSLHHYENAGGYATGPGNLEKQYQRYAKMIESSPNPNIKLFISEWNLQSIDWRTGLFAGGFLNVCETNPVVEMGAAALFIRRTDMPDWDNAFINFDYKDVFVAPNYQVTKLWYDNFSPYRLDYSGETGNLSISTSMSTDGSKVIVKIVNASDKAEDLNISGDWKGISDATYQYYAPGSLDVKNSMEKKDAVALKSKKASIQDSKVTLNIDALSAGVLVIEKTF